MSPFAGVTWLMRSGLVLNFSFHHTSNLFRLWLVSEWESEREMNFIKVVAYLGNLAPGQVPRALGLMASERRKTLNGFFAVVG